jgi:hypothetical protein
LRMPGGLKYETGAFERATSISSGIRHVHRPMAIAHEGLHPRGWVGRVSSSGKFKERIPSGKVY